MKLEEVQAYVKALSDSDLALFQQELPLEAGTRAEKRKQATIAKIKELASAEGLSVSIAGQRGRPPKTNGHRRPEPTAQADKSAVR